MDQTYLLDKAESFGDDYNIFESLIHDIDDTTFTKKVKLNQINILSIISVEDGAVNVVRLYPGFDLLYSSLVHSSREALATVKIDLKQAEESMIEEADGQGYLVEAEGEMFLASASLVKDIGLITGIRGTSLKTASLNRNTYIAKFMDQNGTVTLIGKEAGGVKKLFAMRSARYPHIKQETILDIISELVKDGSLGKIVCRRYYINNFFTSIYLEFPEKAEEVARVYKLKDHVPGVYIATSDTGDSSLTVRGTWRIHGAVITDTEYTRKHYGTVDFDEVFKSIQKTIFSQYTKLPKRLCELMGINITDPALDLRIGNNRKICEKKVKETVKRAFKDIELAKYMGKKYSDALYESLCEEFSYSVHYTAYDIAATLIALSARVEGISESRKNHLGKILGKAPYVDYKAVEVPDVILSA